MSFSTKRQISHNETRRMACLLFTLYRKNKRPDCYRGISRTKMKEITCTSAASRHQRLNLYATAIPTVLNHMTVSLTDSKYAMRVMRYKLTNNAIVMRSALYFFGSIPKVQSPLPHRSHNPRRIIFRGIIS